MRNDLTTAFTNAMESTEREPIQLIVFYFTIDGVSTPVYLSDRDITIDGQLYTGLVMDWGSLTTAGASVNDFISETLQMNVTIWNGGTVPFGNYFLYDDPIDVVVNVYQTFEGLDPADVALLGSFVIQDPVELKEVTRLLTLDLVSLNMRYTANVGEVLTKGNWPFALESDLNKGIDLIVGDVGTVQTLASKVPIEATMSGSILLLATTVNTFEDLGALGFADSGQIIIDNEVMTYNSRTSTSFNVTLRGVIGTSGDNWSAAIEHSHGAVITEFIIDHTYIIGQGPIDSVSNIKFGGLPIVAAVNYSEHLSGDVAYLQFEKHPTYITYSKGARTQDVDFDDFVISAGVGVVNTALQPHFAYLPEYKSYGGKITSANDTLSLIQNTVHDDLGEITRVFLSVEHWESKNYTDGRARVYVEGIGEVGVLALPNAGDETTGTGSVDIDHGHDHATGGLHDHPFNDPAIPISDPEHLHSASVQGEVTSDGSYQGLPLRIYRDANQNFTFRSYTTNVLSRRLTVEFISTNIKQVRLYEPLSGTDLNIYWNFSVGTNSVSQTFNIPAWMDDCTLYAIGSWVTGSNLYVTKMELETTFRGAIDDASTSISASATGGDVQNDGNALKLLDDVDALATANREFDLSTNSTSQKVTEKYDISKHLDTISWAWLNDRNVYIVYGGGDTSLAIYVTYMFFEVEYRQRETVLTNDVTCEPVGSIENRPDAVIQYLLHDIAGIPEASMGSIWQTQSVWDDGDTWADEDVWFDVGDSLDVPSGAAFEDAGARYAYLDSITSGGYTIDGVFPASMTIKDAVKKVCRQARGRVTWSAGKVKLSVRNKIEDWLTVEVIEKNETQLRSLSIKKEEVSKIQNYIDLFYKINHISTASDEGQYDATVTEIDIASIERHGQNKENSNWLFDLVRSDGMAADLADYYIWRHGEPADIYSFIVYLQQFDIEKGDIVRLTSDFQRTINLPMRVLDNSREFGSGKLSKINTINLVAESIRHNFIQV